MNQKDAVSKIVRDINGRCIVIGTFREDDELEIIEAKANTYIKGNNTYIIIKDNKSNTYKEINMSDIIHIDNLGIGDIWFKTINNKEIYITVL